MRDRDRKRRKLLKELVAAALKSLKASVRPHVALGEDHIDVIVSGVAWSVAAEVEKTLWAELQSTAEGRAIIDRAERKQAGKLPS